MDVFSALSLQMETIVKQKNALEKQKQYLLEGVSKRCILFLYKQSPDFPKPGLCHVQKNLHL